MASLRKKSSSKFWWACVSLPNGLRAQKSTKLTDRKKAQKFADQLEEAFTQRRSARQFQKVISDLYQRVAGESLPTATVRQHFRDWLERKKGETSPGTQARYKSQERSFTTWLGDKADRPVAEITTRDIVAFRTAQHVRVGASTVNQDIKFIRMVFEQAKRDGLIAENPAETVGLLKKPTNNAVRRAFTIPELKRVLAAVRDDKEWESLVLLGLYTGQRLGDLVRLTWRNVDIEENEIRLVTSKTGRQQIIGMAGPLQRLIASLPASDDPKAPLHPRLLGLVTKTGTVSTLSRQFYEILADAGLVVTKDHRAKSKDPTDRAEGRILSEISFHSLRHTATSLMKNAGVSPAVVQDIIGHESAAMSASYTHIDDETKRIALAKIPDVTLTSD